MFNIHSHKQFSNSTNRNSNTINPLEHQSHLRVGNGALFLYPDFVCGGCRGQLTTQKGATYGQQKHQSERSNVPVAHNHPNQAISKNTTITSADFHSSNSPTPEVPKGLSLRKTNRRENYRLLRAIFKGNTHLDRAWPHTFLFLPIYCLWRDCGFCRASGSS